MLLLEPALQSRGAGRLATQCPIKHAVADRCCTQKETLLLQKARRAQRNRRARFPVDWTLGNLDLARYRPPEAGASRDERISSRPALSISSQSVERNLKRRKSARVQADRLVSVPWRAYGVTGQDSDHDLMGLHIICEAAPACRTAPVSTTP
ncbi:hypothetical protein K491DRAFT_62800 [Lophiostoma macrostomum CBS 122681]|uniref:Uncharacterized protein n=1 Tax=Lophiostoma macrostomum CBS 122681 TaxID=1314788 RepID=A0A6A6TNU3_9PLEO|nr:hypothetical protein K491DRAFT_62800 [Lophiostoma macrostomum CBS 122681]